MRRKGVTMSGVTMSGVTMSARTPEESSSLISTAINAGDVNAILALYEPDAVSGLGSLSDSERADLIAYLKSL